MFQLALENDPIGNAFAFMAWGLVIACGVAFVISGALWVQSGDQTEARDFGQRLRRRIIR